MIWTRNKDKDAVLKPGTVFEKYTVVKELGHGGMGAVYLVRHNVLDSLFALKVLTPDIAMKNKQFVDRFIREAKLACKIRHPNLITVHDAGQNPKNGMYYIIMDYVSGGSVRDLLKKSGRIPPARALEIITQVAGALAAAKAHHMVHRDIKPDNIMFAADGSAKLADLGIAKSTDEQDTMLTMASSVFGTPAYMSPEQARDSSNVDSRADIYSLGIVFFEMLSGQRPFSGDTAIQILSQVMDPASIPDIRKICPQTPQDLADLIARMTEKNLEKRIPDPDTLVQELNKIRIPAQIGLRPLRTQGEISAAAQTCAGRTESSSEVTMPTMDVSDPSQASSVTNTPEATMPTMDVSEPQVPDVAPSVPETEPAPEATMPTMDVSEPQVPDVAPSVPETEPAPEVTMPTMDVSEPQVPDVAPSVPETEPAPEVTMPTMDVSEPPQASSVTNAPEVMMPTMDMSEPQVPNVAPSAPASERTPYITAPSVDKPATLPDTYKTESTALSPQPQAEPARAQETVSSPPEKASAPSQKSKKGIILGAVAAACLCLVLGISVLAVQLLKRDAPEEPKNDPGQGQAASLISDPSAGTKKTTAGINPGSAPNGGQNVQSASDSGFATSSPGGTDGISVAASSKEERAGNPVVDTGTSSVPEEMISDPLRDHQIILLADTSDVSRKAKEALTNAFGAEKVSFQEAAGMGSYKRELAAIVKSSPAVVVICFALQYAEDGITASGYENVIGYHADQFHENAIPFLFIQPGEAGNDERMKPFLAATRDLCQYRSIPLVDAGDLSGEEFISMIREMGRGL